MRLLVLVYLACVAAGLINVYTFCIHVYRRFRVSATQAKFLPFFLKNLTFRTLESGNLMPLFSYLPIEIAKINLSEILSHQNREINYQ